MPAPGADTDDVLMAWGFSPAELAALHDANVIRQR
jgi:hypothetical protein